MRTLLLGWSLTWPDWVARASFSKYISDWLVAKELWLCKQTSSSGCTLGLGLFTAIIPCEPVNNCYLAPPLLQTCLHPWWVEVMTLWMCEYLVQGIESESEHWYKQYGAIKKLFSLLKYGKQKSDAFFASTM